MTGRLRPRTGETIDRARRVEFRWNGTRHVGHAGDTIASALAAGGVRVFSRSFKYHRPRGILTADHLDPNLMVQVGDEPNVRAGHRLVEEGMEVTSQNTWPSLRVDVRSANQALSRFLVPGFYYKTFMAPRPLWPAYQRVLRRFASGGVVHEPAEGRRYDHRYAHPDVVVAGGGPAGMAAAVAAAQAGATVMLVEERHRLGGHLCWGDAADLAALADLRESVDRQPGIEVLTDSVVTGRYDNNWVAILQRGHPLVAERLIKARAKVLVVASGTIERPLVFEGNDLPGVMLSGAVRRLLNLYGVRPGDRAVVVSSNRSGHTAADELEQAGVAVTRVEATSGLLSLVRATGRGRVVSVELTDGRRLAADLLVTATGWTTPMSLLNMAGVRSAYDHAAARFLPGGLPVDLLATGGIVGDGTTAELVEHAEAVGTEAARRALHTRAVWRAHATGGPPPDRGAEPGRVPDLPAAGHPALFRATTHGFVDFSEDVTSKDLFSAAGEGYDGIELAKRYTTATMGPIQGKLEVVNTVAAVAEATGKTIAETGTTTWRPPYAPITLAALAGSRHEPVRHSPIQAFHDERGAASLVAGQWIRPEDYGYPDAEVARVRSGVGIIDVSPLGKIDLRGPDVPELLEMVYTNRWRKLAVGSVRYGVMCAEDGVVLDDGVVGRLADDRWLMTTTSGGAGRIWNWLDDWVQSRGWRVRMTAVTDGFASINIAGPRSRRLLARLASIDLDPDSFGYMQVRTGTVAGVDGCVVWRIGFTGELSYELHVPAGYGRWVWDALLERGTDLGVAPFGIEAQRIMRLEKGHFIVGQDTDGLTRGYTAGIEWAIRLDKPDFAGRPELVWQSSRDDQPRLVAIQTLDPSVVPPEASQIVESGRIVGRITSSRWSPTLGRSVCLAQVASTHAATGTVVAIRLPDGSDADGRVMEHMAHLDPTGERLNPDTGADPSNTAVAGDSWDLSAQPVLRSPVSTGSALGHGVLLADDTGMALTRLFDPGIRPGATFRREGSIEWSVSPGESTVTRPGVDGEVDVTHLRAVFRLEGPVAADLLARVCWLDLADDMFPDGTAARTLVAGVATELVRDDRHGVASYMILPSRSFAEYVWNVLVDAGSDFALHIGSDSDSITDG
jgi:sarcosine oxidase subunit alpha